MTFNNQTVIIPGRLSEASFEGEKASLIASVSEDLIIVLNTKHNAYALAKQVHYKICKMWGVFLWGYQYFIRYLPGENMQERLLKAAADTEWKRRKTKLFVKITSWLRSVLLGE